MFGVSMKLRWFICVAFTHAYSIQNTNDNNKSFRRPKSTTRERCARCARVRRTTQVRIANSHFFSQSNLSFSDNDIRLIFRFCYSVSPIFLFGRGIDARLSLRFMFVFLMKQRIARKSWSNSIRSAISSSFVVLSNRLISVDCLRLILTIECRVVFWRSWTQ